MFPSLVHLHSRFGNSRRRRTHRVGEEPRRKDLVFFTCFIVGRLHSVVVVVCCRSQLA